MRVLLFIFLTSISFCVLSQHKWTLNDALNFAFYQNGSTKTKTLAFITNNQFEKKNWTFANSLNYTLLYNPKIAQNEFAEKFTLSFSKGMHSSFAIYQYNHSLVRKIDQNHLVGIGYGIRDSLFGFKVNVSYAILNEYIAFANLTTKHNIRNSFRVKISHENKKIAFSSEYFYQPNIRSMNDYTLYGTTKLSFKIRESLAFSVSDVYNYFNTSETPVIHNFTVGFSYNYVTKE